MIVGIQYNSGINDGDATHLCYSVAINNFDICDLDITMLNDERAVAPFSCTLTLSSSKHMASLTKILEQCLGTQSTDTKNESRSICVAVNGTMNERIDFLYAWGMAVGLSPKALTELRARI